MSRPPIFVYAIRFFPCWYCCCFCSGWTCFPIILLSTLALFRIFLILIQAIAPSWFNGVAGSATTWLYESRPYSPGVLIMYCVLTVPRVRCGIGRDRITIH